MAEYSWTATWRRIESRRAALGMTWRQVSKAAGVPMKSWMTGVPSSTASDKELKKIAPVLKTTYEWLKWGETK